MNINVEKLVQELEYAKKNFSTVVIPRGAVEPILKEIKDLQQYKQAFESSKKAGSMSNKDLQKKISLDRPMNKALTKGMKHE